MPSFFMAFFMPSLCCILLVVGVVSVVAFTLVQAVTVKMLDIANTEPINNFFIIITLIYGANVIGCEKVSFYLISLCMVSVPDSHYPSLHIISICR